MYFYATEGFWFTQKKDVPVWERSFSKVLAASQKMFEKNYKEVSDEKKAEYDAELAEWLKEQEEIDNE